MPEPFFVSAPSIPEITPAIVVSDASPKVSVLVPKTTELPAAPASDPMVSEPLRFITPEPFSVTEAVSSSDAPSTFKVPAV